MGQNNTTKEQFLEKYTDVVTSICEPYGSQGIYLKKTLLEGGKFVRPLLFLDAISLWGGTCDDHAYRIASGIELLHNFFLIHDDIMDNDVLRRDMPTLHAYYSQGGKEIEGRGLAIVFGDLIYTEALSLLTSVSHESSPFQEILRIVKETARGQIEEMQIEVIPTLSELLEFYKMKTALYSIYLPLFLAHSYTGSSKDKNEVLEFANKLGVAYQLYDDLIEVLGMKQRREEDVCGDLMRLKTTPLFLKLLEVLPEQEKEALLVQRRSGKEIEKNQEQYLKNLLFEKNIVEEVKAMMNAHLSDAKVLQNTLGLDRSFVLNSIISAYGSL